MESIQVEKTIDTSASSKWTFLKKDSRPNGFTEVYYTSESMLLRDLDEQGNFIKERVTKRMLTRSNNYQNPMLNQQTNQTGVQL